MVHSALALEPAPLRDTTKADIERTLRPKVAGGWVLHRLFPGDDLDFFVLFSSAVSPLSGMRLSSQLGSYAAANGFLDALGAHRRAAGAPATVVNWGYWAETGMAHRLSERDGRSVLPIGILPITPAQAPELFTAVLAADNNLCCIPADWHAYASSSPQDATDPLLKELLDATGQPTPAGPADRPRPAASASFHTATDTTCTTANTVMEPSRTPNRPSPIPLARTPMSMSTASLTTDSPPGQRDGTPPEPDPAHTAPTLEHWLTEQVALVLDMPVDQVDPTKPINRMGIDSLLAAELTTRLRREHSCEITVPHLLKAASLRTLAAELPAHTLSHGGRGGC